jgi:ABC-type lipoprotein export system ATPase subunit
VQISLSKITVTVGQPQRLLFKIPEFKIQSGEKLLIKGASGRGKTTFLHLLAGLFSPDEGHIHIGETQINKLSEEERSIFRRHNMGIIFQKLNLIEHLTILENIELSLKRGISKSKAIDAIASVGLKGRENDRTSVLSLGEQQRVAIARVLASEANIVFADEPTSSLDEKNAFEVTRLLIEACKDKTLIIVSHDHRIERFFSKIINFEELIS